MVPREFVAVGVLGECPIVPWAAMFVPDIQDMEPVLDSTEDHLTTLEPVQSIQDATEFHTLVELVALDQAWQALDHHVGQFGVEGNQLDVNNRIGQSGAEFNQLQEFYQPVGQFEVEWNQF